MAAQGKFDRRAFLRTTGMLGTAAILGDSLLTGCAPSVDLAGIGAEYHPSFVPEGSMLDLVGAEAPIEHVVILMMENRSFDHYLGWLGRDGDYLARGVQRYGPSFRIDAQSTQSYPDAEGRRVDTFHLGSAGDPDPWRGCGLEDPGHSWVAGRAQRDQGFLGADTGNDRFALAYLEGDDLPFTSRLARRFTTFDRYHASVLGPTHPNRHYLHGAQSGGLTRNYLPILEGGFQWDTIWDRLRAAGVPVGSYFSDLPTLALYGERMADILRPVDRYFEDCEHGTLPQVTFLDPPYAPWWQADDHPHADPAAGQRFLRDTFRAFANSPHWERGLFVLTYDEWGGFFDHVAPPLLPDDRASTDDATNFAQAGFRVPTVLASPYARPGYVDHRTYDHTSIMRFLQWRFLGAPPEGTGGGATPWSLTARDRHANNIGASLGATGADPELFDIDDLPLRAVSPLCEGGPQLLHPGARPDPSRRATTTATSLPAPTATSAPGGGPGHDLLDALEQGYFERLGIETMPTEMAGSWAEGA